MFLIWAADSEPTLNDAPWSGDLVQCEAYTWAARAMFISVFFSILMIGSHDDVIFNFFLHTDLIN